MDRRVALEWLLGTPLALAQDAKLAVLPQPVEVPPADYVCPMDRDVRSTKPGVCPRCGMKLVLGIPDGTEYPLEIVTRPRALKAGEAVELQFRIIDPKTNRTVQKFEIVHDKLFHLFIVSQDLKDFAHQHPTLEAGGRFTFHWTFPKPGMYRILGDYYPSGATPQLVARTLIVPPGAGDPPLGVAKLEPQMGSSHCENVDVELATDPPQPISGQKTLLFFKIRPAEGLEKYLSAWGHMLAASDDLIDMIHTHPFLADGGAQEQFNLIFPRARTYRIWVQFQRQGVVNTAVFNVPVQELR